MKNDKLCIFIDFKNLSNTTPKDEYPILMTDKLVDLATGNAILNFTDQHLGYNQIFIAEDNVSKIAFRFLRSLGT